MGPSVIALTRQGASRQRGLWGNSMWPSDSSFASLQGTTGPEQIFNDGIVVDKGDMNILLHQFADIHS